MLTDIVTGKELRLDSIILVGPQDWVDDHMTVLKRNGTTWLQYDASAYRLTERCFESFSHDRGDRLADLFIYLPQQYTGGGILKRPIAGPGAIRYECRVIDWRHTTSRSVRLPAPGSTVEEPRFYDTWKKDRRFPYWFQVDRITQVSREASDFRLLCRKPVFLQDGNLEGIQKRSGSIIFARQLREGSTTATQP